jgi:hypothetical protein
MPSKSTELRLMNFDPYVYTATPSTILYKYVDALCGTSGAGALINEIFLARMGGALDGIYFSDLDFIFGKINFLARSPAESYTYSPMTDMLTSNQWSEVRQKDAWYRARIKEFFTACGLGGTPDGIRMAVQAALAVDCDIYEVWSYIDNFGITENLGRSPDGPSRNEVVVQPHKGSLTQEEMRLVRDMLAKICPMETIVTVNTSGLAVYSPITVNSATSDSTYYEVQKMVTASPAIANLPPPELLPIDLLPTQTWLYDAQTDPQLAPYAAFNISSEYGYYYLVGGGSQSPIDSVTYGTINPNAPIIVTVYEMIGSSQLGTNTWTTPPTSWLSNQLNPTFFRYVAAPYSADTYPPSTGVNNAAVGLVNLINATPGPFVLVGYGLGAIVTSNVFDQIVNAGGSLANRAQDFLGGFAFGNPRRQPGVTFPNCPDPGGWGLLSNNLLADSTSTWWEFAVPGDLACTNNTNSQEGQWISEAFENLYNSFLGSIVAMLLADVTLVLGIPGIEGLLQAQMDLFWGPYDTNSPHFQYQTYAPVPGDARSCVQIALDQINSLQLSNLNALATVIANQTPPLQVMCYEVGEVSTPQTASYIASNLASSIRYLYVPYPAVDTLPLEDAIATGVTNLITLIGQNSGPFMLVGTGEGAIVTSMVNDQIMGAGGSLASRSADYLAAVAFGNPRREAGQIFPGGTDPGGAGISSDLMTDTPSLWWEFANPGDPLCTNPTSGATGTLNTEVFEAFLSDYTGSTSTITTQFSATAGSNVSSLLSLLINVMFNQGMATPHAQYGSILPPGGNAQTSYQLAVAYLNTFANSAIVTPLPTVDPMESYLPAANYQTFDTTGQFTAPIPYATADSPDNYPGGKYGIHPSQAPALNPDGTPYIFPYASQAAYIAQQVIQVLSQGGLANATSYQLPLSPTSSTAQVFYPQYAIAYYPPTKDSTVSTAITARHGNPANQTTTEARDPVNFVRN